MQVGESVPQLQVPLFQVKLTNEQGIDVNETVKMAARMTPHSKEVCASHCQPLSSSSNDLNLVAASYLLNCQDLLQ